MSNPKRMPAGTSEKKLKGVILLSNRSHVSGMNGVFMIRISRNDDALLGSVGVCTT
jgi:hypothetical protein